MPVSPHEVHSLIGFVIVLLAIIAYRFIPPDKTVDYQLLIPMAGIIKRKNEPFTKVHVRIAVMVIVSIVILAGSLYTILVRTFPDVNQNWAYDSIGTILGFWHKRWPCFNEIVLFLGDLI